jgi:hypothetical protein
MLEYIKKNFGDRPSVNASERMELEFLRSEMITLKRELGLKGGQAGESTASDKRRDDDESSSGSEEDEDFVASLP